MVFEHQAERDQGLRGGPTTEDRERIKVLERENRELRQANEILRKASTCPSQAANARAGQVLRHALVSQAA